MEMSLQVDQISTALSEAQAELDSAKKDNSGYGYKYSDLATVIDAAKPVLAKHGLAITQLIGQFNSQMASLTTILTHKSGQFFKSTASIPLVEMKGCNVAQSFGSSISYLRRYSYQAILGMASEDNDASTEGFKSDKPSSFAKSTPAKSGTTLLANEVSAAPATSTPSTQPERRRFTRSTTQG
jgi:hypothetical protein